MSAGWSLRGRLLRRVVIGIAASWMLGLLLSVLASVMVGFAGWHGGKLVFDHGIGILVSPKD